MKKILLVVGTTILMVAGCSEDKLELGAIPLGVDFAVPQGQEVTVDGINSKLTIGIVSTQDSRCPVNAICVWEGNYGAEITISDATQTIPISLCNLFCGSTYKEKDTVSFVLNEKGYSVVLKDLQPYPGTVENDQPKTVVLEIFQ